ncbi:serine/threonine-protein kinase [Streptomyces sp. NPDC048664]|uniref:serine/threonine-protein kinase n=1 Tax=Streptomyces sp. NPDC048664 TaxID=3154505 RepID=UPI0034189575
MRSLGEADPAWVGGYPLFARLGAGGMGQVYLARTPAGRPLALKTVRPEFGLDPAFGERFAREIQHADRVRSPWTVTVVDFSPAGSQPQWLATEYVAAPSLADWVTEHGPLPTHSLTALAAELCGALDAVHRAGLAHRDVKPSNVLLAGNRPLLIDFGIARAGDDSRLTTTGGVIGSPGYMAPEQATGGISAPPADIFALGAVLVYASTGRGPFSRPGGQPSAQALLYCVVHEEPDLEGVPEALLPLIRACLAKGAGDRPTAGAAAELLPEPDRSAGHWALRRPPGLPAELATREADARAALDGVAASPSVRHAVLAADGTTPPSDPPGDTAGSASARSPYTVTRTAHDHLAHRDEPAPTPLPEPPPAPAGRRVLPIAAAGALVLLVLAGLLVHTVLDPGSGHTGSTRGSEASTAPPAGGASTDPNALPASWVGTWVGTGPGNPDGRYSFGLHTDSYHVTLTLHAGRLGELVGQQVSDVHDQDDGKNDGCTESLELKAVNADGVEFAAKSPHTTDPASTLVCVPGNSYELSMIDGTLRLGPGSQGLGAPTTFTRR